MSTSPESASAAPIPTIAPDQVAEACARLCESRAASMDPATRPHERLEAAKCAGAIRAGDWRVLVADVAVPPGSYVEIPGAAPEGLPLLWPIFAGLLVLWLLGVLSGAGGPFIHILLVLACALVIIRAIEVANARG